MSDPISAIATASNIATAVLARIDPVAGLLSSQVSVPAAMANLMNDLASGNMSDTELYILGLGTVPASSSTLTLTARTIGLLAIGGAAAAGTATLGGIGGGIAITAAAVAALTNPDVKNILTDPDFWNALQKGKKNPSDIPNSTLSD